MNTPDAWKSPEHDGCRCHSCREIYRVDITVPNTLWGVITAWGEGEVMLCASCILTRLEQIGYTDFTLSARL